MAQLKLEQLNIMYDDFHAVKDVDLFVDESEIVTLLGPSGCGKTSILRTIAGFIEPASGKVILDDKDITELPPQKRDMGMIFQNYALWPHMSVRNNIAYGLKIRGVPKEKRDKKVMELIDQVELYGQVDKFPGQLSGGQQQRVALTRALAIEPNILLCDEPLSNLDAGLRTQLRTEIRDIAKDFGVTVVYVTHDQTEALAISDKIAVINEGKIMQIGTPFEIFSDPDNHFVGKFVGENNLLSGKVENINGNQITIRLGSNDTILASEGAGKLDNGQEVDIIIRHNKFSYSSNSQKNTLTGKLKHKAYMGDFVQIELELEDGTSIMANINEDMRKLTEMEKDEKIHLKVDSDKVYLFEKDGKRIREEEVKEV